ncbi:MAG: c-type cytochrome [bacterium]|nr:c-type cytochrome [bacterium]
MILPTITRFALAPATVCLALASVLIDGPPPAAASQQHVCGRRLYLRNCAPCHGDSGLGDGPGAALVDPAPRDFSQVRFRLVSTDNGIPTRQDLFDVITHGIVGSAMPPHEHLSLEERSALVDFVRGLTRARRAEVLQAHAAENGESLPFEVALEQVHLEPGASVALPPLVPSTPELLAEGRRSYVMHCAPCHDEDGRGRSRTDLLDERGRPIFARDFTAGILKGGTSRLDLFRRIRCGMPGSPMPRFEAPERESWALLHHVESLIQPGAKERLTQVHTVFRPERVEGRLDADPAAAVWNEVSSRWVAVAPLQWTDERVDGFHLQVARDESSVGLRLVWEDSTPWAGGENVTPDTATVRFSLFEDPQFFCPGREGESAEIWQWQTDLGDYRFEPLGVVVESRHEDGRYELVFLRELEKLPERVGMSEEGVSVAFELRNGAAGDSDRSQNLTVWHRLAE